MNRRSFISFIKSFNINAHSHSGLSEIIYLITGGLCVTLFSLLVALLVNKDDIWLLTIVTGSTSLIYLIFIFLYFARKPQPLKTRVISFVILALHIIIFFSFTEHFYYQSNYQKNALISVRSILDYGAYNYMVKKRLTDVLITYYKQQQTRRKFLGEIFKETYLNDSTISEDWNAWGKDGVCVYVSSLTDDEVVLIGSHGFTKGKSPAFKNYTGQRGMIQVKGVLTKKGVKYEIQN